MIPNRAMHHNYVIQPELTSDIQFLDSKTKFREMLPLDLVEEVKNENKWSIKLCTFFNKGLGLQLIKKGTMAQVFSCKFCKIFISTYLYRTPQVAASEQWTLHKNWSFPLRISSVNVTYLQFPADLATFTDKNFNGKLHFLCSVQQEGRSWCSE